jgi:type 1 fimbriae regulatory protein FimB/type 1 fimbriae regulatory protein FimE
MLRYACGYKLAQDGQDTRAIQHAVHYTQLSPERFKDFWKD